MKFATITACLLMLSAAHAQQSDSEQTGGEIYKHVLPDGTIVYTDQPPTPNAQPMTDLPTLTVVPPVDTSARQTRRDDEAQSASDAIAAHYATFELLEPIQDQTYWNTGYTLTARVSNPNDLLRGHRVRFLVDGENRGESETYSLLITDVWRGEHQLQAQIIDSRGNVLASTDSVTFHMKQTAGGG